jgi:hypothetical protein
MDRRVVFSTRISPQRITEQFSEVKTLELCFQIGLPRRWTICAEVILEKTKFLQADLQTKNGLIIGCTDTKTVRTVLSSTTINGKVNDYTLARAAISCDVKTSEDIAHQFFFAYIVKPSVESMDKENWFRVNANELWEYHFQAMDHARTHECRKIHES